MMDIPVLRRLSQNPLKFSILAVYNLNKKLKLYYNNTTPNTKTKCNETLLYTNTVLISYFIVKHL